MSRGLIVVTEPLRQEIFVAVEAVKTANSIYVSRSALESEITDHPGKYPMLGIASRTFQRQVITKVMKRQFAWWGDSTATKRSTFVWDVTRLAGVLGHA